METLTNHGVNRNNRPSQMPLIRIIRLNHQIYTRENGRGTTSTQRQHQAEPHPSRQNRRCEVGQRIRIRRCHGKHEAEHPDFGVASALEILLKVEGHGIGVSAVLVDPGDHPVDLFLCEEFPGLWGLLGEVDDEEPGADAEETGQDALHLWGGVSADGVCGGGVRKGGEGYVR